METCILCLRTDGGSVGQEHVLQDFLGAGIELPHGVVCDRCNGFASALDGDLRRFLNSTLFRTPTLLNSANAVVLIDGTWWATRIDERTWRRRLPAQCVVRSDGDIHGVADNEALMLEMRSELARARQLERRDSDSRLAVEGQPIVIRSAERQFHLLATDPDDASTRARVASIAAHTWKYRADLQLRLDREGAHMRAVLSMNVRHANRALIKAGFNFLAFALGPDIARLPLFAPIRGAVLADEGDAECMIDDAALRRFAGLHAEASDAEAVGVGVFDREHGEPATKLGGALLQSGVHSVVLGAGRFGLFAFVALRGRPVARVQLLPPLPGFTINGIVAAWIVRAGERPQLPDGARLDELRAALRSCAAQLPDETAANDTSYIRSQPQPFVLEATYTPGAT